MNQAVRRSEFQLIRVISRDRSVKWERAEGCLDIQTRGWIFQAIITRKWGADGPSAGQGA